VPPSFEPRAKSEDISTGETAHLLTELLCKCGESLEADVGSIALELFRRVEIEDEVTQPPDPGRFDVESVPVSFS
jgi:hypothetical protein